MPSSSVAIGGMTGPGWRGSTSPFSRCARCELLRAGGDSDQRTGAWHHGGEIVAQGDHLGTVHVGRADDVAVWGWQVTGGTGGIDYGAAVTIVLGGAHGGADARMSHKAADDQVQMAQGLQTIMQIGAVEGVGHAFFDD